MEKRVLAFDFGASSGRAIIGHFDGENIRLEEVHRFSNDPVSVNGTLYWDVLRLFFEIKQGLTKAKLAGGFDSIGIDTWGVDFAFVGKDGSLLGLPYAYRDPHTDGAPEEYFSKVLPREEVYGAMGIQIMQFNSLYQLYAMQRDRSSQLAAAERLLFMPNALSYLLTGEMVTEYTIASTSQLLNPRTKRIEARLLEKMGLSPELFPPIVMPGHRIGTLRAELAAACGLPQLPVIAVAGHDTASAVAAVPAADERFAYLSSGTWSLMGIEVREPFINELTERYNFTNEGGVEGTTRLLKNITGMWILEQCLRKWKDEGRDYTYPEIVKMATGAAPFRTMIDPDDASFAAPGDMPAAIRAYCERTGQPAPGDDSAMIRAIFESLALKYRFVLDRFRSLAPFEIERLHVIGGGSKNALLNQFTADSLGIPVTAVGNIMLQARAAGCVGTLQEMRTLIARCIPVEEFTPGDTAAWDAAYTRFMTIVK